MKLNKPPKWTGIVIGKMHNECITREELAKELGQTKSQITMTLNGQRKPKDAKAKYNDAFGQIVERRKADASI